MVRFSSSVKFINNIFDNLEITVRLPQIFLYSYEEKRDSNLV